MLLRATGVGRFSGNPNRRLGTSRSRRPGYGETPAADRFVAIEASKSWVNVHIRPEGIAFRCASEPRGLAEAPCQVTIDSPGFHSCRVGNVGGERSTAAIGSVAHGREPILQMRVVTPQIIPRKPPHPRLLFSLRRHSCRVRGQPCSSTIPTSYLRSHNGSAHRRDLRSCGRIEGPRTSA
jgi:hypothetical protein